MTIAPKKSKKVSREIGFDKQMPIKTMLTSADRP